MDVDKALIKKVAENARLSLSEKEIEDFVPELQEILTHFSALDEIDASAEKPSFRPVEVRNVLREDIPENSLSQEEALSNAEHKKEGYFKGPRAV